jgi:hypothetical protein
MKKIQTELLSISKSISELASKIVSLAQELEGASPKKAPAKKTKAPAKKTKTITKKVKPSAKAKRAPKKTVAKKAAPAAKNAKKRTAGGTGIIESIYGIISRSRNGVTVSQLREKTNFVTRQVNNAIYKLKQKDKIEAVSRGVYKKKKA